MKIDSIIDQSVQNLSGGELQRVALTLCLGKPADVYLIDEPSAYLDSEQRLSAAKVIKRSVKTYSFKFFQIWSLSDLLSENRNWCDFLVLICIVF